LSGRRERIKTISVPLSGNIIRITDFVAFSSNSTRIPPPPGSRRGFVVDFVQATFTPKTRQTVRHIRRQTRSPTIRNRRFKFPSETKKTYRFRNIASCLRTLFRVRVIMSRFVSRRYFTLFFLHFPLVSLGFGLENDATNNPAKLSSF